MSDECTGCGYKVSWIENPVPHVTIMNSLRKWSLSVWTLYLVDIEEKIYSWKLQIIMNFAHICCISLTRGHPPFAGKKYR